MTFGVERVEAMMNIFVFFFKFLEGERELFVRMKKEQRRKRVAKLYIHTKACVWIKVIFVADKFMQDGSKNCGMCGAFNRSTHDCSLASRQASTVMQAKTTIHRNTILLDGG